MKDFFIQTALQYISRNMHMHHVVFVSFNVLTSLFYHDFLHDFISFTLYLSEMMKLRCSINQSIMFCVVVGHWQICPIHYNDVIMTTIASQITSLAVVYSTVYSDADQRKHQSSASLAFVWGIHRGPVNSPHKGPVTRKTFPFDDIIMICLGHFTDTETITVIILFICAWPMGDDVTM